MKASQIFEKFLPEYIKSGASNNVIFVNFLPSFINEALRDWGYQEDDIDVWVAESKQEQAMFEIYAKNKKFIITENGTVFRFKEKNAIFSGFTFTGDENIRSYKKEYSGLEAIDCIENIQSITDFSSKMMENTACEIVSYFLQ